MAGSQGDVSTQRRDRHKAPSHAPIHPLSLQFPSFPFSVVNFIHSTIATGRTGEPVAPRILRGKQAKANS